MRTPHSFVGCSCIYALWLQLATYVYTRCTHWVSNCNCQAKWIHAWADNNRICIEEVPKLVYASWICKPVIWVALSTLKSGDPLWVRDLFWASSTSTTLARNPDVIIWAATSTKSIILAYGKRICIMQWSRILITCWDIRIICTRPFFLSLVHQNASSCQEIPTTKRVLHVKDACIPGAKLWDNIGLPFGKPPIPRSFRISKMEMKNFGYPGAWLLQSF